MKPAEKYVVCFRSPSLFFSLCKKRHAVYAFVTHLAAREYHLTALATQNCHSLMCSMSARLTLLECEVSMKGISISKERVGRVSRALNVLVA